MAERLTLDDTEYTALLAGDEDATGFLRIMAAVPLVDLGPLDRTADTCLGVVKDVPQGVAVGRVIGQRPGAQHEQATASPAVVGDDDARTAVERELVLRLALLLWRLRRGLSFQRLAKFR